MYKIEKKKSGYLLTFGGFMDAAEMKQWLQESIKELESAPESFGIIVDMRALNPLPADAQAIMVEGQKLYKTKGMQRSAVALQNAITAAQFTRLAKESGIYNWERYIDASSEKDWAEIAIKWVVDGIDPDN